MTDGIGVIKDFAFGMQDSQDDGGNFEVQPDVGKPLGTIVMAIGPKPGGGFGGMNTEIVEFLKAQGVQDVISNLDLTWLSVAHTDEVVSFQSSVGNRARVASPEAAWALLLIAKREHGAGGSSMLQNMNGLGASGTTVDDILDNTTLRADNFGLGGYSDKILEEVREPLGIIPAVEMTGSVGLPLDALRRAGYLDAFDPSSTYGHAIQWKLIFTSANDFDIWRLEEGATMWEEDGTGNRLVDSLSESNAIYILEDWWKPGVTPDVDDEIHFTSKPSPNMIEMPVLFFDYATGTALAYTNNVVNSIVHGEKLLVADVAGPDVGGGIGDIFDWYVKSAAVIVGFNGADVVKVEEKWYHNDEGSVHCATNVIRVILGSWWDSL
jgi:hypothetical protein